MAQVTGTFANALRCLASRIIHIDFCVGPGRAGSHAMPEVPAWRLGLRRLGFTPIGPWSRKCKLDPVKARRPVRGIKRRGQRPKVGSSLGKRITSLRVGDPNLVPKYLGQPKSPPLNHPPQPPPPTTHPPPPPGGPRVGTWPPQGRRPAHTAAPPLRLNRPIVRSKTGKTWPVSGVSLFVGGNDCKKETAVQKQVGTKRQRALFSFSLSLSLFLSLFVL